jgi:hypothetical protein
MVQVVEDHVDRLVVSEASPDRLQRPQRRAPALGRLDPSQSWSAPIA